MHKDEMAAHFMPPSFEEFDGQYLKRLQWGNTFTLLIRAMASESKSRYTESLRSFKCELVQIENKTSDTKKTYPPTRTVRIDFVITRNYQRCPTGWIERVAHVKTRTEEAFMRVCTSCFHVLSLRDRLYIFKFGLFSVTAKLLCYDILNENGANITCM